jgi:hypothetical protein
MSIRVQPESGPLSPAKQVQVEKLQRFIASELREKGESGKDIIITPDPWPNSLNVLKEIQRIFAKDNWQVSIQTESQIPYLKITSSLL